jgi:hypothetical protein
VLGTVFKPVTSEWIDVNAYTDISEGDAVKLTQYNSSSSAKWTKEFDFTKDWELRFKIAKSPLGTIRGYYYENLIELRNVSDNTLKIGLWLNSVGTSVTWASHSGDQILWMSSGTIDSTFENRVIPAVWKVRYNKLNNLLSFYENDTKRKDLPFTILENVKIEVGHRYLDIKNIKYIELAT